MFDRRLDIIYHHTRTNISPMTFPPDNRYNIVGTFLPFQFENVNRIFYQVYNKKKIVFDLFSDGDVCLIDTDRIVIFRNIF